MTRCMRDILVVISAKEKDEKELEYVGIIIEPWCLSDTYDREEEKKEKS